MKEQRKRNCQIEFPTKHVSEPSSDNKHNVGSNKKKTEKLFWYDREQQQQKGTITFCVNSISSHMLSKKKSEKFPRQ